MNKTELVEALANGTGKTKVEASRFLETLIMTVTDVLKKGDQIVIPGFLSLSTGHRAARPGRNPQTGKAIQIKAARVVKAKAGKSLKEAVQEG